MSCRCSCGYICGRDCDLPPLECIEKHYKVNCGHVWGDWVEGETPNGGAWGSQVCLKCGVTNLAHAMAVGP